MRTLGVSDSYSHASMQNSLIAELSTLIVHEYEETSPCEENN